MPNHDPLVCHLDLPSTHPDVVVLALCAAIGRALADQVLEANPAPDERLGAEWIEKGEFIHRVYSRAARQAAAKSGGQPAGTA